MLKYMFHIPIFHYSIDNWSEIKPKLNEVFKDYPLEKQDVGSPHTDYVKYDGRGPYVAEIIELIRNPIDILISDLGIGDGDFFIDDIWHQRYEQYESHRPHTHGESHLGCTLYLNFIPGEHPVTRFYAPFQNFLTKDVLEYEYSDTKEGDIIFFPASIMHESPINLSETPKEIIGMNISIPVLVKKYKKENPNIE